MISLLACLAISKATSKASYEFVPISAEGGDVSVVLGITSSGTVVGSYQSNNLAFYWNGGPRNIPRPSNIGPNFHLMGMSDQGYIAGQTTIPGKGDVAFICSPQGHITLLAGEVANDVNDHQQAVGLRYVKDDRFGQIVVPVLFQGAKAIALTLPDGYKSGEARLINEKGQIVGVCGKGPAPVGMVVRWDAPDKPTLLADFDPHAMNNLGDVVGQSRNPDRPCIFRNGKLTILGDKMGEAWGVNDNDVIVGGFEEPSQAFLFKNGKFINLSAMVDPQFDMGPPAAINNHGVMVGKCFFGGHTQAYILKP